MSSLGPDLLAAVAAAPSLAAGVAVLVRGLAPTATAAEAQALLEALTRNTSHLAISADHPGFARAQRIFEAGELEAAAQLADVELKLGALELGRAKLLADAEEAREAAIAANRDLEHARALIAGQSARLAELEAALAAPAPLTTRAPRRPR